MYKNMKHRERVVIGMGDSLNIIDLIFLILSFVIGYKIYVTLGKRTGHEKESKNMWGTIATEDTSLEPASSIKKIEDAPLITGLKKVQMADRSFSPERFLAGSQKAFEIILRAYLEGDEQKLKSLVSPQIMGSFLLGIQDRQENKAELAYFRLVSSEVLDSDVRKGRAMITVKFVSEQTVLTRDKNQKIVEGDPDAIDEVIDVWVFERSLQESNPNWVLTSIQSQTQSEER
jgi:predicted lipid-binding transport protein (Tim44 family)